jgi:pimeloyl-ACP methyl ester carboxylesterase
MFIHGLESSNQGTKSVFFRQRYPDMLIPTFTGPLEERMDALERHLQGKTGIRLVGSSFGGLMATLFALENEPRVEQLILLAPAINLMAFTPHRVHTLSLPVRIFHGLSDEVIPLEDVRRRAEDLFSDMRFHKMDDDHSLHQTFPTLDWDALLGDPAFLPE